MDTKYWATTLSCSGIPAARMRDGTGALLLMKVSNTHIHTPALSVYRVCILNCWFHFSLRSTHYLFDACYDTAVVDFFGTGHKSSHSTGSA